MRDVRLRGDAAKLTETRERDKPLEEVLVVVALASPLEEPTDEAAIGFADRERQGEHGRETTRPPGGKALQIIAISVLS